MGLEQSIKSSKYLFSHQAWYGANEAATTPKVFHDVEASCHEHLDPANLFTTSLGELRNAAWSPDGHWILFCKVVQHVLLCNRVF